MNIKDILVGTLKNMSPSATAARYKAMDSARRERDDAMIRENFGNEENYRKTLGLDTPEGQKLFTPAYVTALRAIGKGANKVGDGMSSFAKRLMQARQKIK